MLNPVDVNIFEFFNRITVKDNEIKVPYSVVTVEENHDQSNMWPLKNHPLVINQLYDLDRLEVKYAIEESIKAFKELMKDKDPKKCYFLPLINWPGIQCLHCRINNFPVRVSLSFSHYKLCYVLGMDLIHVDH